MINIKKYLDFIQYLYIKNNFILKGGKQLPYDEKQKKNKKGIYRIKYEDIKDLDKNGNPKIKFQYYYIKNNIEVSNDDILRINKLGIAPAYENVWVSDDPETKIQATGIDAKGRKQYRYHKYDIAESHKNKFLRLYKFIKAVPKLMKSLEKDIKSENFSKDHTIAIMLYIVKETNMRVGKEHYAKTNKSYGISSLKKTHLKINKDKMIAKLNFKAKSNKQVQYTLDDPIILKKLQELFLLDGIKLFQYKSNGNILKVNDTDLNNYIRSNMGKDFTIKDFRTYASNFYFIKALLKETRNRTPNTQKIAKKNINLAQETTAFHLRHTKSISKKSYTMELIREKYLNDTIYFINNKNKQPLTILIELLKIFKNNK